MMFTATMPEYWLKVVACLFNVGKTACLVEVPPSICFFKNQSSTYDMTGGVVRDSSELIQKLKRDLKSKLNRTPIIIFQT